MAEAVLASLLIACSGQQAAPPLRAVTTTSAAATASAASSRDAPVEHVSDIVSIGASSQWVASADEDGLVLVRRWSDGARLGSAKAAGKPEALCWEDDAYVLVVGASGTTALGPRADLLFTAPRGVERAGDRLLYLDGSALVVRDRRTAGVEHQIQVGDGARVRAARAGVVAIEPAAGSVLVLDLGSGEPLGRCTPCREAGRLELSPNGHLVAIDRKSEAGVGLEIVDVKTDTVIKRIPAWTPARPGGLQPSGPSELRLVWSPTGERAVVTEIVETAHSPASLATSRLFDAKTWRLLSRDVGVAMNGEPRLELSSDGRVLFVGEPHFDGERSRWFDASNGAEITQRDAARLSPPTTPAPPPRSRPCAWARGRDPACPLPQCEEVLGLRRSVMRIGPSGETIWQVP